MGGEVMGGTCRPQTSTRMNTRLNKPSLPCIEWLRSVFRDNKGITAALSELLFCSSYLKSN